MSNQNMWDRDPEYARQKALEEEEEASRQIRTPDDDSWSGGGGGWGVPDWVQYYGFHTLIILLQFALWVLVVEGIFYLALGAMKNKPSAEKITDGYAGWVGLGWGVILYRYWTYVKKTDDPS